ncbi:hypothetical protein LOTGIDRAFT_204853 [Lottia gigantea]|uniref:Carbohydrate kinase PfkB domain-containing protein n=1 Tax=Lottia gigantea TaxID=225164 RepID=V4B461_LOTGI|nr:hypothetical protein LOTGIDRAFT_204853 [Lottia gigantea]ESO83209.1 hypothetical protein LOTGIDRAFT_204853 [Lottia gigantea]
MEEKIGSEKKRVLCVGWTCVDIVTVVETFPEEDTDDTGIMDYYWQRGGNASNTASVLSTLGRPCELLTVLPKDSSEYQFLKDDLQKYSINTDHCVLTEGKEVPIATVLLSRHTGSSTVLYTLKDLPELKEEDFTDILQNLHQYCWIHFEGRPNVECIIMVLDRIQKLESKHNIVTSVGLDNPDHITNIEGLVNKVDYLFISKYYATKNGFKDKNSTVQHFSTLVKKDATVICKWGNEGAAAKRDGNDILDVTGEKIDNSKIVDSLGVGDTFVAAFIDSILESKSLQQSLASANFIAAKKLTIKGYSGVANFKS